jgi:hypothetical protein
VAFFAMILYFARNSLTGTNVQEKILAKQVALFANSAKPDTLIILDITDYLKLGEKNKVPRDDIVKIQDGVVYTRLDENSFTYPTFSDHTITAKISGNFLEINIG